MNGPSHPVSAPGRAVALHPGLSSILTEIGEVPPGPFVPARFQREALAALGAHDVLVSAPTGSGKTWIAQETIRASLAAGRQAWYTTPLKALSNQKFRQFQALFGEDAVGLLTGERRDRKSTRLNSSHIQKSRMPSSA